MTLDTHPILDVERRLGGTGPFVINLHASTAPIGLPSKSPAGNEHARLYQIQRVDDGRIRYRLRLGPFATEDEAEIALAQARLEYPGALMVTAAADDLHAIGLVRGKAHPGGSSADVRSTDTSADARNTDTVLQPVLDTRRFTLPITADPVAPAALPAAAVPVSPLTLTLVEDAPARAAAPVPPLILTLVEDEPVRAAAPVLVAAVPKPKPTPAAVIAAPAAAAAVPQRTAVSVASDIASMQALIAAIDSDIDTSPNKVTIKPPVLHTVPAAKVTARRDDARAGAPVPSLESTQTLRPLTPLELGENEAARWFVVQLALSDDAFDPDALPHLDIFSLYRLYTVVGMDQGRLVHALRLGFFGEEVGARAVASYLSGFYDEPIVKRVSVAERDRFADQRVEARKDVGATGRHLAIEITDELVVRGRRSSR
ncbi:MAG TPA: SPOR domain-containing protein [Steroidobacteraceae bacterium]|nr:SPOR domain-containing protein [Steroidobacteraceae bacterium]